MQNTKEYFEVFGDRIPKKLLEQQEAILKGLN
jgi:hypothetical protein